MITDKKIYFGSIWIELPLWQIYEQIFVIELISSYLLMFWMGFIIEILDSVLLSKSIWMGDAPFRPTNTIKRNIDKVS